MEVIGITAIVTSVLNYILFCNIGLEGIMIQDNISNMAHIVGGIVGAGVGYGLNKRKKFGY